MEDKDPKKNKFQEFLDFIEKHKKFIKKLILFAIAFLVLSLTNNPVVNNILVQLLGDGGAFTMKATTASLACVGIAGAWDVW